VAAELLEEGKEEWRREWCAQGMEGCYVRWLKRHGVDD